MRCIAVAAACAALVAPHVARADDKVNEDASPIVEEARAHFAKKEFAEAKTLLLEALRRAPDRDVLFALGQVEIGLGNPAAAIPYYERYLTTDPPERGAALAQQAISVARGMLLAERQTRPSRITRRRPWDIEGTGLVVLGAAGVAGGAGLFYYGQRLGDDTSGTLTRYDRRIDQARRTQWIAAGVGAAGAILITAAIVRWRISSETIEVAPTATGATVSFGGRW